MINKNFRYAVIGASHDEEKYGFKVFKDLIDSGYNVVPINPKGGELLGKKVWPSVLDFDDKIDVAIMVIPSSVGLKVLENIKLKKIGKVWFQPGSESDELVNYCREYGIECMTNACIMIERKKQSN